LKDSRLRAWGGGCINGTGVCKGRTSGYGEKREQPKVGARLSKSNFGTFWRRTSINGGVGTIRAGWNWWSWQTPRDYGTVKSRYQVWSWKQGDGRSKRRGTLHSNAVFPLESK
jgi:hypothetical protein